MLLKPAQAPTKVRKSAVNHKLQIVSPKSKLWEKKNSFDKFTKHRVNQLQRGKRKDVMKKKNLRPPPSKRYLFIKFSFFARLFKFRFFLLSLFLFFSWLISFFHDIAYLVHGIQNWSRKKRSLAHTYTQGEKQLY